MIELDKRIIEGKKPLTAFDVMESKFIGTDCYFSDKPSDFADLSKCQVGKLMSLDAVSGMFGASKNNSYAVFCFCLPCEWVEEKKEPKEPKYREYKDLDEFFDVTGLEIGDLIHLKFPGGNDAELLIVGGCDNGLFIGIHKYTFAQLFAMVEISISGEWQPFGVLE